MPFRHMRWYHLVALWAVAIPFIAFEAIREIFCGEQPEPLRKQFDPANCGTFCTPRDGDRF